MPGAKIVRPMTTIRLLEKVKYNSLIYQNTILNSRWNRHQIKNGKINRTLLAAHI
jgi:hypothetical protein